MSDENVANAAAEVVADQTMMNPAEQKAPLKHPLFHESTNDYITLKLDEPGPVGIAARAAAVTFATTLRRLTPPSDRWIGRVVGDVLVVIGRLRKGKVKPVDLEKPDAELEGNFGSFSGGSVSHDAARGRVDL